MLVGHRIGFVVVMVMVVVVAESQVPESHFFEVLLVVVVVGMIVTKMRVVGFEQQVDLDLSCLVCQLRCSHLVVDPNLVRLRLHVNLIVAGHRYFLIYLKNFLINFKFLILSFF